MNAPANIAARSVSGVRPPAGRYKLTRGDYLLLGAGGSFATQETELIDGCVFVMSPEWIPHMRVKDELAYHLRRVAEERGLPIRIGTGASVDLSDVDQPRPDITVVREFTGDQAIQLATVLIVVEVSSSTLAFDLGEKAATYARSGVPEYWVADVAGRVIYQRWNPFGNAYAEERMVGFGDLLTSSTLDGLAIATDTL